MIDPRSLHRAAPAIDALLLAACLKAGFLLQPASRPELLMVVAAVVMHLVVAGRRERPGLRPVLTAAAISGLFWLYWQRAVDAWPVAAWLGLLHGWRYLLRDGLGGLAGRMQSAGRQLARILGWVVRQVQCLAGWRGMRYVRIVLVGAAGVLLMWPYLARGLVGAGDSYWYALSVADYVEQLRAGQFPVWLPQTDYAFYGGALPLRYAPWLQHLAGGLDLLTGRQWPPYGVVNLALVTSLVAALWSAQYCLGRLAPRHPWKVAVLAVLYGLCPGVLGLAYAQDLFMSFGALPFLPVIFLGLVRCHGADDMGGRFLLAGGLAAAWLAHPPIAMWCGLVAVCVLGLRILQLRRWTTWRRDLAALGWFVVLAGYSVVSVKALGPQWSANASVGSLYYFLQQAFPANWLPLHPLTRSLDNLQVGYGVAAVGLFLAWQARGPDLRLVRILLAIAGGLGLLLTPMPFLTEFLWGLVPQTILNITNIWPAQRLVPILAVGVIFAGAIWTANPRHAGWRTVVFGGLLLAALGWGGREASKFASLAMRNSPGWEKTATKFVSENRAMTYPSIGPHPVRPRYFNDGVTDVELEHRFLSPDTKAVIRNATDAILPGFGPGTGAGASALPQQFSVTLAANGVSQVLGPEFTLEPGRHYLLGWQFLDREYEGALLLEGTTFSRMYGLPQAGAERAFGAGPANARWLALWQTSGRTEQVRLTWLPAKPERPGEPLRPFAGFVWREYSREQLDVRLESLLPYRAKVRAPAASYLETPRLCIPRYRALLDGREVPVEQSPDGFVMVRMEAGEHTLELRYEAPWPVRVAYFGGLLAWVGFLFLAFRQIRRPAPGTTA